MHQQIAGSNFFPYLGALPYFFIGTDVTTDTAPSNGPGDHLAARSEMYTSLVGRVRTRRSERAASNVQPRCRGDSGGGGGGDRHVTPPSARTTGILRSVMRCN